MNALPSNAILEQEPKQLRRWVAERLRAAILDGTYLPGEWLRQQRLAEDLGVSQMPVREALKELAAEGLVEHLPYRGVRVVSFSPEDLLDLYAHRAFLEGRAAAIAAEHITTEELATLESLQAEMEQNFAPQNVKTYRELNRRFHEVIFTASRREYLIRTLSQMWAAFPSMLFSNFATTATNPLTQRDDTDIREHRAIIAALRDHNPQASQQTMQSHINNTANQLLAALRGEA